MSIIETEIWKPNPERPGTLVFDSQRKAQDIFTELEAHLKADGRMPDEYFLFDAFNNWSNDALFPKDAEILCNTNYGGNEGVYLDIAVRYKRDVYEHSKDTGALGWHNRMVTEHFATGKTLGESIDDLDRMNLVASSVMAAFYGNDTQVRERYANIESGKAERIYPILPNEQKFAETAIPNRSPNTAQTVYGEVQPGDWVISTGNSDYGYLIGTVTAIDKLGTPEHETENETDDIHVDFAAFDYPPERIAEIEEDFSDLYGEQKTFGEIALDDVIMAPEELISISNLSQDEITRMGNLRANCEAFCNCFPGRMASRRVLEGADGSTAPESADQPGAVVPQNEKHATLIERLNKNLADFRASFMELSKSELINKAGIISAVFSAHEYLSKSYEFKDSELDYLLKFQNPLEVVADALESAANNWQYQVDDYSDVSFAVGEVFKNEDVLESGYALMPDPPERTVEIITTPAKAELVAEKPKTLSDKLRAASEKVKAQDSQNKDNKSHKREER